VGSIDLMSTVHSKTHRAGRSFVVLGVLLFVLTGCGAAGVAQSSLVTSSDIDGSGDATATAEAEEPAAEAAGCPATPAEMPAGAASAEIADVDGDGENDTEWYSEASSPFTYGITTASGATHTLTDDLAGPGTHSGWTATLHNGVVVTVLDDGRSASLHAFVDCEYVTPIGVDGRPYTFDMQNLRGNGTGVGCLEVEGGLELNGLQVAEKHGDTYALMATGITVSENGLSAMNGYTAVSGSVPEDDRRVSAAQTSSCANAAVVSTSGH
jgi:hypothetical protein